MKTGELEVEVKVEVEVLSPSLVLPVLAIQLEPKHVLDSPRLESSEPLLEKPAPRHIPIYYIHDDVDCVGCNAYVCIDGKLMVWQAQKWL
jgi:hypothetical protein